MEAPCIMNHDTCQEKEAAKQEAAEASKACAAASEAQMQVCINNEIAKQTFRGHYASVLSGDMAHVQHVVETHLLVKNHVPCWSGKGAS